MQILLRSIEMAHYPRTHVMALLAFAPLLLAGMVACGGGGEASSPGVTGGAAGAVNGGAAGAAELPAVPSCGADSPQADGAGASGTYTVPVSDALAQYASFPLDGIQFCEAGGIVTLSYKFPSLLLGSEQHVAFSGVLDRTVPEYALSSSRGTARCTALPAPQGPAVGSGVPWTCKETLSGLAVDSAKLAGVLEALPPVEAAARRQVATAFGQDPIGVLEFSEP